MSFLRAYQDYAGRFTDAPPLFHLWTGIGLLATALGNEAHVWAYGRRICANLWIVLLAPSGVLRKTTALNIGQGVLLDDLAGCADRLWPSEWSFEGLLDTMQATPGGLLLVREFKRFNAALRRDYAGGVKELLVDTYDNPIRESRRTKTGGEVAIEFPAPSIVAATTLDWFEASLQEDDIGGGFLSRMFIIPAKERGAWRGLGETRSDADHHQRQSLAEHLAAVRERMTGEIDTRPIEPAFNEWLREYEATWINRCPPELTGTIARAGTNALKLALIFEADGGGATALSLDAFDRARMVVEDTNEIMAGLVGDGLGLDRDAKQRRKVLAAIRAAAPDALAHSDALRNLHLSKDDLNRHVRTLVEAEQVIEEPIERGSGKRAKGYRWLNGATP